MCLQISRPAARADCNPGLDAIRAVLYPTKSDYNYFMTGDDGVMRYARTLEEHI